MEKVDLDYLRKQWKDELGYYWGRAQKEINEYFKMIKDTLSWNAEKLKTKSREQVLKDFSLDEKRLKDPLFIPEMLNLLVQIKKINYDVFPDNWVSGDYDNKEHASFIYNILIPRLAPVSNKIIDFKVTQYNGLYDKPELPNSRKVFINKDFEKFGLKQYDHHLDLINSIAYHDKFFTILPNLLRTLFENILHDIFKTSLNNKHKTLYFDKHRGKIADFGILIKLLIQLSQIEFKDKIRTNIFPNTIKILKDVKKIGNLSVHEVVRKITKSHADEIQDKIDLALEALLVSYYQLENADIIIEKERFEKIIEEIGLSKMDKIKKKKKLDSQQKEQFEEEQSSELSDLISEIRSHIDGDLEIGTMISEEQKKIVRIKMDHFIFKLKALGLTDAQRESIKDAQGFFNSSLGLPNPQKGILHAMINKIMENIL